MRILLVEDDLLLGDGIRVGLSQEGYTVDWVTDGVSASEAAEVEPFDLMVLDLNLPKRSGIEVLKTLRDRGSKMPVLILTARDTLAERVQGLDAGADDYLTKPFDLEELCARARALQRRAQGRASPKLAHGDLVLDPAAHTVTQAGVPVELSSGEFTLLRMLLEQTGRVVSRSRMEQTLYGWVKEVDSNTIEVYIHHLRKKLGSGLIRTVRGAGYRVDKAD
jgi:two-component system response regulator QseB